MPRSNIFEAGAASIAELFDGYLENPTENGMCVILALSARPLGPEARDAIEKSFAALGYGKRACTFAVLRPHQDEEGGNPDSGWGAALDAQALFLLVEGLDPVCIVATDEEAVHALGGAYRTEFPVDSAIRVFGRSSVAFRNLASLLETDSGKQKAWRIFKSIPRR